MFSHFFSLGQETVVQYLTGTSTGTYATVPVRQGVYMKMSRRFVIYFVDVCKPLCNFDSFFWMFASHCVILSFFCGCLQSIFEF